MKAAFALVAVMLFVLLSGCGGDDDDNGGYVVPPVDVVAAPEASPSHGVANGVQESPLDLARAIPQA